MRRLVLAVGVLVALAACTDSPVAPKESVRRAGAIGAVSSDYIVQLNQGVSAADVGHAYGARHVFSRAINGFAASLNESQLDALRHNPNVESVTPDVIMSVSAIPPSWGLDRIDARSGLDNSFVTSNNGSGVTVYMVDTGIRFTHQTFQGRASLGWDVDGSTGVDCNGHGTHTAGTVGGFTYGVANGVTLKAVKVFPACSGQVATSSIIAGMDWIAAQTPGVVSMSLGGPGDLAMDAAISNLVSRGFTVVVAAGNSSADACLVSPARAPAAITVGATTDTDARSSFSNWGACVDLFAPGSFITSAWPTADDAEAVLSGTSMATPHVAGVAALILHDHPTFTPAQVDSTIKARDTKGAVTDARSDNFHLLYSGLDDDTSTPVPPPPPPAPLAPSNVASSVVVVGDTYSQMRVTWRDNSDNEDGFVVRGTKGSSEFHTIGIGPNATSLLANLPPGTWTVTVSAYNAGGENTSPSIQMCVPTLTSPCSAPPPPPDTVAPPDTTTPPPPCRMRGKSGKCR